MISLTIVFVYNKKRASILNFRDLFIPSN